MPSATQSLQQLMIKRFGDLDLAGPQKYLKDTGYILTRDWEWEPKSGVSNLKDMTQDEYECLLFLVDEWDYGSLKV